MEGVRVGTEAAVERYMTTHEAAARLRISERAVRGAIARGEVRALKVCRRVRIAESEFDRWVAASQVQPVARRRLEPVRDVPGTGLRAVLGELVP
jgi:excisionase family DNA binding protein